MIMKKRLLALLCALTLAVGAAACATSGSGENETNAQQTEDNNNTGNTQQTEDAAGSTDAGDAAENAVYTPGVLSNPDASEAAQDLFTYICDTYGNAILSGQQESTWMGSEQYEFDYIYDNTGKYPAIRGLDYMNDDFDGVNRRAKEWYDRGGIVTICWHCGSDFSGSWSECMNTTITDWDKALTEGTPEYETLIKGMDKAAEALQELQEENIPVL